MTAKKELTKQETSSDVAAYSSNDWGDVVVEQKDLTLPKILIQHATSESVKTKKMAEGELLNTLTNENLGTSIEILPFFKREHISVDKWNGKRFEFFKTEKYDGKMKPFEEEIDGVRYKNSHVYEFFCLTKDLGLPVIIPFKGTSNKIGKKLVTLMYVQNIAEKLTPAGKWITYTTTQESNRDGDIYSVAKFAPLKNSTKEEVAECLKWIPVLKDAEIVTAEEPLTTEPAFETTKF